MYDLSTRGLVSLALQFLLPLLVGFVTKQSWGSGVKAVLLLVLSAVTEFLVQLQAYLTAPDGTAFDWKTVGYYVLVGFVISVAAHYGLWKPTGASDSAQRSGVSDASQPPLRR